MHFGQSRPSSVPFYIGLTTEINPVITVMLIKQNLYVNSIVKGNY